MLQQQEFRIFPRERWAALERFSCRNTVLRRIGRPSVRRLPKFPGDAAFFRVEIPSYPLITTLGMKCPRRARRNRKPSISERCRRGLRKHSAGVGRESTPKSSRARRRRQSRAANPCYASRAERHCNFRNHCICTAREDRSSLVAPTSPRGHIAVCTVCFLACPRIRTRNPETPEQLRFRRFRQTSDPRVSCCAGHRSTVQISGPPCIVR